MKNRLSLFMVLYSLFCYTTPVFSETWIQTTDADFSSGNRTSITIDGSGTGASVNLSLVSWYEDINWKYRQSITVNNSTSTLTDFQVWISTTKLDIAFLKFDGKMKNDYGDIRFTESDGTEISNYWICPDTNSPSGIWVKVPALFPGTTTLYIYYGNSGASAQSNFDNTMQKISTTTAFGSYDSRIAGLWHFDEGSGTTTTDVSNNENNGTFKAAGEPAWVGSDGGKYNGISTTTVKFVTGNSLQFDGDDDYVDCGSAQSLNITENITISAWVNLSGDSTNRELLFKDYSIMRIRINENNKIYNFATYGGAATGETGNTILGTGEWYHIAYTYDGSFARIFLNGQLDMTPVARSGSLSTTANTLKIGYYSSTTNFNGIIDEVAIYNVALSTGEIVAHYERRKYANPEPAVTKDGSEETYDPASVAYFTTGNIISSSFDSVSIIGSNWGNISWNATEPASTGVKFQIATNNDNTTWSFRGPDGSPTTYYSTSDSSIWFGHDGDRYIKYKAYLSGDGTNTPSLGDISITYTPFSINNSDVIQAGASGEVDAYFAKLIIPANTINRNIKYTLAKKTNPSISVIGDPMESILSYDFTAEDADTGSNIQNLDGVITLIMRCKSTEEIIDNTDPPVALSDASGKLAIAYWDGMKWQIVGGNVSVEGPVVTITTKVNHFTEYGIVIKPSVPLAKLTVAPNPFTPCGSDSRFSQVYFTFSNENNENVELKIYNLATKLMRTIDADGAATISWDGRNKDGDIVEGGVYLYQLKVGEEIIGKGAVVLAK